MNSLSLKTKLLTLAGSLLAVALLIGGIGFYFLEVVIDKYGHVESVNFPNTRSVQQMYLQVRLARMEALHVSMTELPEDTRAKSAENIATAWKAFEEADKAYNSIPFLDGEEVIYNQFSASAKKLRALTEEIVATNAKFNESKSPELQKKLLTLATTDMKQVGDAMRPEYAKLIEFHTVDASKAAEAAESSGKLGTILSVAVLVAGILAGGLFSFFFANSLSRSLLSISNGLNDSGVQVSAASTQLASSSESLSQATTEQAAALEETAASVEEMNSMVAKTSENAKRTLDVSGQSQATAVRGQEVVREMMQSMRAIDDSNSHIMEQVNKSNQQIGEIVKVIQEIGAKTKVINDIVFQTKLLSFNASVEAARAGEHGKGFAVVAEEVGNLAQMSGNAAKEISGMLEGSIKKVEGIVDETKTTVERLLSDGKAKVEQGTRVAEQCGEVLKEIVQNVSKVSEMSLEISQASEEQARGVQEITKAMGQLDQVTQQNAGTSQEASSAAEELSGQAASMKQMVEELMRSVLGAGVRPASAHAAAAPQPARKVAKPAKSNVVALKPRAEKAPVAPLKKAAGGSSTPDYNDPRFEEV